MTASPLPTAPAGGEVTILLDRKTTTVTRQPGETLLETAPASDLPPQEHDE